MLLQRPHYRCVLISFLTILLIFSSSITAWAQDRPVARVGTDIQIGSPPLTVQFSDSSQGEITSWQWDFGDGSTSTEQNPSHTYSQYGRFTVNLVVEGPGGLHHAIYTDHVRVLQNNTNRVSFVPHYVANDDNVGHDLRFIKVVDYDNDGDNDVLLLNNTEHRLEAYVNNGQQQFTRSYLSEPECFIICFNAGDMDNDGDVDLVVADGDGTGPDLMLYENSGDGTLVPKRIDSGSANAIWRVNLADLSCNNYLDIHLYGTTPSINAFYNDNCEYTGKSGVVGGNTDYVDIDQDGDLDFFDLYYPTIYFNDGSGGFHDHILEYMKGYSWSGWKILDLDGDRTLDLIVTHSKDYEAYHSLYLDMNSITTQAMDFLETNQKYLMFSDFGFNGLQDILTIDIVEGKLNVFVQTAALEFQRQQVFDYNQDYFNNLRRFSIYNVPAVADLDNDGDMDIIFANLPEAQILWFENEMLPMPYPPVAAFGADVTKGQIPLTVQFGDSSSGNVTDWLWEFGDGSTSTQQHPRHIYQTADTFDVTLTAAGPGGSHSVTRSRYIMAVPPPVPPTALFAADTTTGTAPLTVRFTDLSTGDVSSWYWDFGDNYASMEQHPYHTFKQAGTYDVSLSVIGPAGSDDRVAAQYIIVTPNTAVEDAAQAPSAFRLYANNPNPFNPVTQIQYDVKAAGPVKLEVYDVRGRLVSTMLDEAQSAGRYTAVFDAAGLPSGIYILRYTAGTFTDTRKMVLSR